MMDNQIATFVESLSGRRLESLCCEADMLDFGFSGGLFLHAMGFSRVIRGHDILISTFDYQSWDEVVDTNNDEWWGVEQYGESLIGGTVLSASINPLHDLRIELDNGAVIECLVANAYPHYQEEHEQWVLFEHTADHSGRFLTVYNKWAIFA